MSDEQPNRFQAWLDANPDKPEWIREKVRLRGLVPFEPTLFKGNGFERGT